ncbi:MAG: neutral/alkaline non-lysosomal ceramidase N-terminal domain-containing protein [Acidobacteria bacterium]|nr:neutral/alkaline non-lysosomal ceramidase N-terminal domain-containing protein [Acidobacteriota bacterium]
MIRLLPLLLLIPLACAAEFRGGVYAADITPQKWPVRLIGGFDRIYADRASDPLHARAFVFDDGSRKTAIVVIDSCYLPRPLYDRAKARASKATGIPTSHMLMAATHSHSAPPSKPEGASVEELAYQKLLEDRMVEAVTEAHRRREPALIGWTVHEEPEELHNRRWFVKPESMPLNPFGERTDQVRMNPPRDGNLIRPAGGTDPGFTVVSIKTKAGKPLGLLANYSLHYVGNTPRLTVSADYFGEFARLMKERLAAEGASPAFVAALSNGTSGDVNNINFHNADPRREPMEKIRIVAGKLADSAMKAYRETKYSGVARIGMEERELPLRYRKPTAAQLERAQQYLAEPDEKKLPARAKAYAERAIELSKAPEFADVLLQTMRIGDLGIAAIPCEVFTETGLAIKAKSPLRTTFTMELANGHYGYLPTPEQHELGGYETWLGTNRLEKEASRKITAALLEMFGRLAR